VSATCPECGAALPEAGTCRDFFHELLALEAQVPDGPGELPHFLAVASYNLQHPSQFTEEALIGLCATLADLLAGRATLEDIRRRTRHAVNGPTRVLRQPDDPRPTGWPTAWPLTVTHAWRAAPEDYAARVREWAEAVSASLP
jgi:hypothetical protein